VAEPYHPSHYERIWRSRAEEFRTIGDGMTNDAARQTYYMLADDYERLADRAARAPKFKGHRAMPPSLYQWPLRAAK